MKKLLSVLLVITMVFSMMSSVTAFASEDVVPAEEPISEDVAAPADDPAPVDDPAPAEEPAPAEDLLPVTALLPVIGLLPEEESAPAESLIPELEIPVAEEPEEEPVEEEPAAGEEMILDGAAWAKADGFVDGQTYIIGVDNGDGSYVVLQSSTSEVKVTAVPISDLSEIDATMIWTATRSGTGGTELRIGDTRLYSDSALAREKSSAKWYYTTDGNLYYAGGGGGDQYMFLTFDESNAASTTQVSYRTQLSGISDVVILTSDTDLGTGSTPLSLPISTTEATELTTGTIYVIGIENADGTYTVLQEVDKNLVITQLDDPNDATDDMLWIATESSGKFSFENVSTGHKLSYKDDSDGGYCIRTKGSTPKKWTYADGVLAYDSTTYLVVTETAVTPATAVGTNPILLWSAGEGDADSGGDAGSGGSGSSGGTTVYWSKTDAFTVGMNIAFDVAGMTFGTAHGNLSTAASVFSGDKLAVTTDNALLLFDNGNGGIALAVEDPPGEYTYLWLDANGLQKEKQDTAPAGSWSYADGLLSYTTDGVTYYLANGLTVVTDPTAAATATAYSGDESPSKGDPGGSDDSKPADPQIAIVKQPDVIPYVTKTAGESIDAPIVTVSAQLVADQLAAVETADELTFQWYVNDEAYGEAKTYKVADFADSTPVDTMEFTTLGGTDVKPGAYVIYCLVSTTATSIDETTGQSTTATYEHATYSTTFIVTEGVLENSFMTFSDVHQNYDNIGFAINDVITIHGGFIPALIICTGDWNNSDTADYNETLNEHILQNFLQVGNIDMIFVAGNHDDGAAAADTTIAANLGAATDYSGAGQIYDDSVNNADVGTSAANTGLKVFGLNYETIKGSDGFSYNDVIPELEAFLDDAAANYNGELIVISAHAGLHVVNGLDNWSGKADYNIDDSNKVVAMLNEYAETYNMDIMFFFGHDHSKSESEFLLVPGDTITTVISFDERTYEEVSISFTYGHAGYIGKEHTRYSLVTWDQETIDRLMYVVNSTTPEADLSKTIDRVAEFPEPPAGGDDGKDDTKPSGDDIPDTGDDAPIVLLAVIFVLCTVSLIAVLPRKKHN